MAISLHFQNFSDKQRKLLGRCAKIFVVGITNKVVFTIVTISVCLYIVLQYCIFWKLVHDTIAFVFYFLLLLTSLHKHITGLFSLNPYAENLLTRPGSSHRLCFKFDNSLSASITIQESYWNDWDFHYELGFCSWFTPPFKGPC